jgi:hypothetical protein
VAISSTHSLVSRIRGYATSIGLEGIGVDSGPVTKCGRWGRAFPCTEDPPLLGKVNSLTHTCDRGGVLCVKYME